MLITSSYSLAATRSHRAKFLTSAAIRLLTMRHFLNATVGLLDAGRVSSFQGLGHY